MVSIEGDVSPGYESVAQAFRDLFDRYAEVGAALALSVDGELVINIWAGTRDREETLPWREDTRCNVFSASKALVAISVLQLIDRGLIDFSTRVADVWPEFGCNGKQSITIGQVLAHRSGLNAFHRRVEDDLIYDWDRVVQEVAGESPWWPPGTEQGYSPMIFGWLLGEVVCRVSGADSFGEYVRQRVAAPLDCGIGIGLREEEFDSLAEMGPIRRLQKVKGGGLMEAMRADPRGVVNLAFSNPPTLMAGTNGAHWRGAQIPAANAHASALDLAKIYTSLVDESDQRLLSSAMREPCWQEQSTAQDRILNNPISISRGAFMRLLPEGVESQRYFCHPGAGGSLGYGDASERFGLGFVSRAMGQSVLLDERAEYLLRAVYRLLRGQL